MVSKNPMYLMSNKKLVDIKRKRKGVLHKNNRQRKIKIF